MKMVFQQKVAEKESKLKQSEEELYARHREMKEALEKQRLELEDKSEFQAFEMSVGERSHEKEATRLMMLCVCVRVRAT